MTAAAVPQPGGEPNPPCAAEGAPNGGYGGHPSTGGRGGAKIFCWWRRLSPASASDDVDVPPGPSALWKPVNHGRNGRALRWRPVEVQGSLPGSAPTGKGAAGRFLCCPCGGAGGSFCVQVTRRIPPSDVRQGVGGRLSRDTLPRRLLCKPMLGPSRTNQPACLWGHVDGRPRPARPWCCDQCGRW